MIGTSSSDTLYWSQKAKDSSNVSLALSVAIIIGTDTKPGVHSMRGWILIYSNIFIVNHWQRQYYWILGIETTSNFRSSQYFGMVSTWLSMRDPIHNIFLNMSQVLHYLEIWGIGRKNNFVILWPPISANWSCQEQVSNEFPSGCVGGKWLITSCGFPAWGQLSQTFLTAHSAKYFQWDMIS